MNFRSARRKQHGEVSAGALTDIMFFLLLFFLIASTITNPNVIKIMLPEASSGNVLSKRSINLTVTKGGSYFIDKKEVLLENLQDEMAAATAKMKDPTVNLRVDRDVTSQQMIAAIDVLQKLKLNFALAVESK